MIGCDECDDWYHWVCVGIRVPPSETESWFCQRCIAKKQGSFKDKKKGRKKKSLWPAQFSCLFKILLFLHPPPFHLLLLFLHLSSHLHLHLITVLTNTSRRVSRKSAWPFKFRAFLLTAVFHSYITELPTSSSSFSYSTLLFLTPPWWCAYYVLNSCSFLISW